MHEARHGEDYESGGLLVRPDERFGSELCEVDDDLFILEILVEDFQDALLQHVHQPLALGALIEQRPERPLRHRRHEQTRNQQRQRFPAHGRELPVHLGVARGNRRDGIARPVQIGVRDDVAPIVENGRELGVGINVFQPVLREQPQLVVPDERVRLDEMVSVGVHVQAKSGRDEFPGHAAAAEPVVPLEDEHFLTRLRQVGGRGQPVMAGAGHDDVVGSAHLEYPVR